MKYTILLFVLLNLAANLVQARSVWSETNPQINITHIFKGEINRRGKPVGFHVPATENKNTNYIKSIVSKPNRKGIFSAKVKIWDKYERRWKQKFSTMFPRHLTNKQIVKAILHAYRNKNSSHNTPWRGPSGHGFPIEGYLSSRGGINTAYPIYIKD